MIDRFGSRIFLPTALFLCACSPMGATRSIHPGDQSFLDIAKDPNSFDGREVKVRAWISYRHEDFNAWATAENHDEWNTVQCISLSNYGKFEEALKRLDGKSAYISGIITSDASEGGKMLRLAACRDVAIRLLSVSPA